ncbi:hypothetical protein [Pelotomaculum propionicicum]|uniref:Uncharacterized protein n=1 Tax=Pelotomaculum propionicicum TaxID=258475 RepID=A0A4Y7RWU1_9FIRM|nr:hypothetical protein [Pelotomaculum propionicicum]TEB13454.1 hypothetical protein Pmgp_00348 [Pelotomaculum propionicicum]
MESTSLNETERRAHISIRLSEFEIPPIQDVLLIGRRAPIGPEAIQRMIDVLSPEQYEIFKVEEGSFEAVVFRKSLSKMLTREKLLSIILEEGCKVASETSVLKARINIVLAINIEVEL